MTNKQDDSWMHKEIIEHPGFEEAFEEEYKRITERSTKEKFAKAFHVEMAKYHDPEKATQEARKNLEANPGFYDSMEE